ncbi:chymotrypsinogen A-like isoform X2 [Actinia tenebrosa]|uniref:Chymotrypsinogen A-like isoform X2 n=1 Tax=Actinia tenebrosa TaxID=6105 RepID=A0A6P8J632_ACTTE|nr:chymotrypsinogen A-like isoform X2 [Actinia tenebrosa]
MFLVRQQDMNLNIWPFYGIFIVFAVLGVGQAIQDICGTRSGLSRIAGGKDSSGIWPWQVELLKVNKNVTAYVHKCGGVLIDEKWVITAASCVFQDPYPTFYKVKIGKRDRSKKEPGEQEIFVESLKINRDFLAGDDKTNDIALLKLAKEVKFGRTARPICLPEPLSRVRAGKMCVMTGWGRFATGEDKPNVLQEARVPIVSHRKCDRKNGQLSAIDDWTMLCAGFKNKKKSGCQGDSGGPLVCKEGNRWVLRGIISWGSMKCDGREAYSVFTRVSHFMHWMYFVKLIPQRTYKQCMDNHWYCGDWEEKGLCTNNYYKNILRIYCPRTCGHCKN